MDELICKNIISNLIYDDLKNSMRVCKLWYKLAKERDDILSGEIMINYHDSPTQMFELIKKKIRQGYKHITYSYNDGFNSTYSSCTCSLKLFYISCDLFVGKVRVIDSSNKWDSYECDKAEGSQFYLIDIQKEIFSDLNNSYDEWGTTAHMVKGSLISINLKNEEIEINLSGERLKMDYLYEKLNIKDYDKD